MDQNQLNLILTDPKRKTLVTILIEIGQIAIASIAVPFFLEGYRPLFSITALLTAIAFWYLALVFSR